MFDLYGHTNCICFEITLCFIPVSCVATCKPASVPELDEWHHRVHAAHAELMVPAWALIS